MNMKLEVVIIPVSDVDRATAFYEKLGFRLDIDIVNENFRGIQFTPPNSDASIIFGRTVTKTRGEVIGNENSRSSACRIISLLESRTISAWKTSFRSRYAGKFSIVGSPIASMSC